MELQLIRSFLEVAESGSFAAASDRLFVTQSAVSLRIQRLEDQLGQPLFSRSNDGVALTTAGREFRGYAETILGHWEQARQRVSATGEARQKLAIGAKSELWSGLGFRWLDLLGAARPDLQIEALSDRSEALAQALLSDMLQVILSYTPLTRAGVSSLPLFEEKMILVSTEKGISAAAPGEGYIRVEAGEDFARFHQEELPHLQNPSLVMALGGLTRGFLLSRSASAYLPEREVHDDLRQGRLYRVAQAPVFTRQTWVIWRESMDQKIRNVAEATLNTALEDMKTTADRH
ncbi:LysR family transcriptional regulator [Pseudogemmobacter faecipullorum]|uniref:LysR family transcriptional regulator n=1 Tax=Pseudogemmobacter faecipullorum TaxID=2755041 RepID=A0ABS8CME8_9RHOB|nr:LysR family transcriptional regulator [Pseudogemmobacter faecipullorum]MCB5410549.1 LysR family transcriptional regulator [Pseudogemmobacter faecipullorum]